MVGSAGTWKAETRMAHDFIHSTEELSDSDLFEMTDERNPPSLPQSLASEGLPLSSLVHWSI
jgi:hypothetical protein